MSRKSALKDEIRGYVRKWQGELALERWILRVFWADTEIETAHKDTAAQCTPDWRYMEASLTFCLSKMKLLGERGRERVVVHELLHCLTSAAVKRVGSPHDERLVTTLAMILLPYKENEE